METKSPASTSGALLLTDAQVRETLAIMVPSHVNLIGYTSEDPETQRFETVELDWEVASRRLTHPSATAAYAVFRTDCLSLGIPPVSFGTWLKTATAYVAAELMKEPHHLQGASAHL